MTSVRLHAAFVLLFSVLTLGATYLWTPRTLLASTQAPLHLDSAFPASFAGWRIDTSGPAQLVSPDQAALLSKIYSQTLSRTYVGPQGARIMLSVAYGGDQSDATRAHRPEVCYPAQGFQIVSSKRTSLELSGAHLPVQQLVAKQGARVEPITYWIMVGEKAATTGTDQKLAQLSYTLRGVIPDGMLVRVSNISPDSAEAFRLQRQFLEELVAAMPRQVQARVVELRPGAADKRIAKAG